MSRWQEYDWDLMVRRKAPAPLIAAALLLAWWVATAESGSLTVAKCKADHNELLSSIEDARQQTIQQINAQIAGTDDQLRTASLKALRERALGPRGITARSGAADILRLYECRSKSGLIRLS